MERNERDGYDCPDGQWAAPIRENQAAAQEHESSSIHEQRGNIQEETLHTITWLLELTTAATLLPRTLQRSQRAWPVNRGYRAS